jgi:hypothetical protein
VSKEIRQHPGYCIKMQMLFLFTWLTHNKINAKNAVYIVILKIYCSLNPIKVFSNINSHFLKNNPKKQALKNRITGNFTIKRAMEKIVIERFLHSNELFKS